MSYRLRHYPYSGGHIDLICEGSMAECRKRASSRIYSHRNVMEYPVSILERGEKWEMETGEDACMIGDGEGLLCIEEIHEDEEIDECLDSEEDEEETGGLLHDMILSGEVCYLCLSPTEECDCVAEDDDE